MNEKKLCSHNWHMSSPHEQCNNPVKWVLEHEGVIVPRACRCDEHKPEPDARPQFKYVPIKPEPHTSTYWDYHECTEYIEKKYDIKVRDVNKIFINYQKYVDQAVEALGENPADLKEDLTKADQNDPEVKRKLAVRKLVYAHQERITPDYLDFWHEIMDRYQIHNGCDLEFSTEHVGPDDPEWFQKIYNLYLNEFGEGEAKNCTFYVAW